MEPTVTAVAERLSAFAQQPAAITPGPEGARHVTHRGLCVGAFDPPPGPPGTATPPARRADRGPLPFDELDRAGRAILAIELQHVRASARRIAARRPRPGRADQLAASKWQVAVRRIVRDALNALDYQDIVALAALARTGDTAAVTARLHAIAGGSLRHDRLEKAIAAKTIELAGVETLRDALENRADRRARRAQQQRLAHAA